MTSAMTATLEDNLCNVVELYDHGLCKAPGTTEEETQDVENLPNTQQMLQLACANI